MANKLTGKYKKKNNKGVGRQVSGVGRRASLCFPVA